MVKLLIVAFAVLAVAYGAKDKNSHAGTAKLTSVATKQSLGSLNFYHLVTDGTVINGTIKGLTKSATLGFIIHDKGTFSDNDCTKIGDHFNPATKNHGGLDLTRDRHVGDLGNIVTDANGEVKVDITLVDTALPLSGDNTIIGKVITVHEHADDLGTIADDDESKKTGNVGAALACGLISKYQKASAGSVIPTMITFVTLIIAKLL